MGLPHRWGVASRLIRSRMADWGDNPRGRHPGGEGYNNEPICPPDRASAIHPDTPSRQVIRDFSLERVFGATFRKQLPLSSRETNERGRP